jgi:Tfp pilus assembly protein PilN
VKALRLFFNKYLWAAAAFCIWMMFFDQNDWTGQRQSRQYLRELQENTVYLTAEIVSLDSQKKALLHSPLSLEKFAREKYRMKRDGEDLYVIEKN